MLDLKTATVSIRIVKLQNLKDKKRGKRDRPPTKERLIMGSQQQVTENNNCQPKTSECRKKIIFQEWRYRKHIFRLNKN